MFTLYSSQERIEINIHINGNKYVSNNKGLMSGSRTNFYHKYEE